LYKLIIFDWDGTIIDSAARIVSSMQAAATDLGHPPLTAEAVRDIIGLGLPEAILTLLPFLSEEQVEQMRERYAYHYVEADQTPTKLFPGVASTLEKLHQQGYILAVATGKSRRGLDRVLADTGLGWLFQITRCADETASKPDPLMLTEILQETGVKASEALMVGDTEYDLGMAQRADMPSVGVSYGVHEVKRLEQYDPRLILHNFTDLAEWLKTGETSV